MYKDGFELKEGKYFWARMDSNPSQAIFVIKCIIDPTPTFYSCGSMAPWFDDEITLLAEILPPA